MFERLKQALVESFVGTVALGYLLAQCILHFVNIFASPLTGWVTRSRISANHTGRCSLARFLAQGCTPRSGQVPFSLFGLVSPGALAILHAPEERDLRASAKSRNKLDRLRKSLNRNLTTGLTPVKSRHLKLTHHRRFRSIL